MTNEIVYPWQQEYITQLGLEDNSSEAFADTAFVFPGSEHVLQKWKEQHIPVQINIVIVSPNSGNLPLRTLNYTLGAFRTARSLRKVGINALSLRIINPVHLNAVVNQGNAKYQEQFGKGTRNALVQWKNRHMRDLSDLRIDIDQGTRPSDYSYSEARSYSTRLSSSTLESTIERMDRHDDFQQEDPEQMAALYLFGHPVAWQFSSDGNLFNKRPSQIGIVNFVPQSELLYLQTIQEAGIPIYPSESNIITAVSSKNILAPYYFIPGMEKIEKPIDWEISNGKLQKAITDLTRSRHNGSLFGREIQSSYRSLLYFIQTKK